MSENRYVKPSRSGWDIVKEGHRRATDRTATKKEAVAQARELTRQAGGGEVRVMNKSGKLTASDTIPPRAARPRRARTAK